MDDTKVRQFITLAGNPIAESFTERDDATRCLGAQLLLSETLEYVIKGLGVTPIVNGVAITEPDALDYKPSETAPDKVEMLDGLADVAYTMYWNEISFGIPLEKGFDLVCDNNLEKFVLLSQAWTGNDGPITRSEWHCDQEIAWPEEVESVEVVTIDENRYAVGKDGRGKVRKPSSYQSVDLSPLL